MSREIKFRCWDKLKKTMIYGGAFMDVSQTKNVDRWVFGLDVFNHPDDVSELMQYTGLKDSEGTEVYEGDLFGVTNLDGEFELVGEVIFDTDLAQFTVKYTNGGWAELWQHLLERTNKAREVVGNRFENPELKEERTEHND